MGLYQYIREQEHRNDLVGELGRWMCQNYGQRPSRDSLAFQIASQEFAACGEWTRQDEVHRINTDKALQRLIKIEPRITGIITDILKVRSHQGYDRDIEYNRYKAIVSNLVGYSAEKREVADAPSYDLVIQYIVSLLPPDGADLYPNGYPDDVILDL
jgi:hypothetical protein